MNEPLPPQFTPEIEPQLGKLMHVDVSGRSPSKWIELRSKLMEKLQQLLDRKLDETRGTTVGDELKSLAVSAIDAAKAKLQQPGADLEKTYAEIHKIYAERRRELAEADKLAAEAHAQWLNNEIKELRLTLAMSRAALVGEKGKEALLFGRQIDRMLKELKEIAETA